MEETLSSSVTFGSRSGIRESSRAAASSPPSGRQTHRHLVGRAPAAARRSATSLPAGSKAVARPTSARARPRRAGSGHPPSRRIHSHGRCSGVSFFRRSALGWIGAFSTATRRPLPTVTFATKTTPVPAFHKHLLKTLPYSFGAVSIVVIRLRSRSTNAHGLTLFPSGRNNTGSSASNALTAFGSAPCSSRPSARTSRRDLATLTFDAHAATWQKLPFGPVLGQWPDLGPPFQTALRPRPRSAES